MPTLQRPQNLWWYFVEHKGCPVPSPVLLKKWVDSFVANIRRCAARNRIPLVQFERRVPPASGRVRRCRAARAARGALHAGRVLRWWHMVSFNRPHHRYTYAQYAALERESSTKHEFFDGEIYAMAGGTEDHAALAVSTLAALLAAVGDRPCRVSSSVLRIYVEAVGLATFPDGSVICGPMQQHPPSPDATAVNPLVLLEVTSDSSEEYDTNGKLDAYKTIPTVREVILVSHRERRITIHRREAAGAWLMRVAIAGGRISVETLGAELIVDAIYRNSSIAR